MLFHVLGVLRGGQVTAVAERWETQNREFLGVGIRAQHGSIGLTATFAEWLLETALLHEEYLLQSLFPYMYYGDISHAVGYSEVSISSSSPFPCFIQKNYFVINATLYESPRSFTSISPRPLMQWLSKQNSITAPQNAMDLKTDNVISLRSHELGLPVLFFWLRVSCGIGHLSSRDGSRL